MKEYEYKDTEKAIENAIETAEWVRHHVAVEFGHEFHPVKGEIIARLKELEQLWSNDQWTDELTRELRSIKGKIAQNKGQLFKVAEAYGFGWDDYEESWYRRATGKWNSDFTWCTWNLEWYGRDEHDDKYADESYRDYNDARFLEDVMDGEYDTEEDARWLAEVRGIEPRVHDSSYRRDIECRCELYSTELRRLMA